MNLIVEEEFEEPNLEIREATFFIHDEDSANWYLRKLANLEAEKYRVKAQSEKILSEIERNVEKLQFLYGHQLEEYVRANLKGKSKTLHLLQGSVSFRKVSQHLSVMDKIAAEEYTKQWIEGEGGDNFWVVTNKFNQDAYRKRAEETLKESGELLPGIEVVPEHESMSVKFGKE
jgi:hypothetical protein